MCSFHAPWKGARCVRIKPYCLHRISPSTLMHVCASIQSSSAALRTAKAHFQIKGRCLSNAIRITEIFSGGEVFRDWFYRTLVHISNVRTGIEAGHDIKTPFPVTSKKFWKIVLKLPTQYPDQHAQDIVIIKKLSNSQKKPKKTW